MVLARCQPVFPEAKIWKKFYRFWHSIIYSPTEDDYDICLQEFQQLYAQIHRDEVGYIKATWLILFKEKLVKAWVDQSTHFGNTATSRVEGIHALLKSYLQRSTFDLFDAWKAIQLALQNQLAELHARQVKQQTRTPLELSGSLYGAVQGWVSHEAMRKVEEQRKLLLGNASPSLSLSCTGTFSQVYGLPCSHKLSSLRGEALVLSHFHPHWHLRRKGTPQLLLEPRQRIEPIRARSSLPKSSTKREPSQFEIIESQGSQSQGS